MLSVCMIYVRKSRNPFGGVEITPYDQTIAKKIQNNCTKIHETGKINIIVLSCIFGRRKLDSFQMRFIRIDQCDGPRAEIIYVCWVFCLSPLDVYVCKKHFFFWFSEHRAHTCEHDIKSDLFRADSTTHNSSGIFNLVSSKAICNRHSACLVPASQAAEAAAGLSYYSFGQNVRSVKCKLE